MRVARRISRSERLSQVTIPSPHLSLTSLSGVDMQDIDQRDPAPLNALQGDVPLASTPFAIIGQMIEMSEKEVIKRIERLKREGVIRQVSAQFDMRALG